MLKHTRISFLWVFLIIFLAHPVAANCPVGNLNDDCAVNLYDLRLFVMQWMDDPGGLANFDGENGVDFNDFAILAGNWEEQAIILKINEFMASNSGAYADPQDQYDDWIEIYNPLGVAFDLGGMWLEDDNNQWQIPDDNPAETTIGPYGYLIIWADGDTGDSPGLHASFALDKESDEIYLYDIDGTTLIDSIIFDDQITNISYGRYPDATDNWYYMSDDTPLLPNTVGLAGIPYFSHPGGTFSTTFDVNLTTKSPTADIYYTTNGDEPTGSSTLYTSPINISLTTWVRARAYEPNLAPSPIVSKTYIKLHSDVQDFESNLPIVIIDSFGLNIDWENRNHHPISLVTIDTDEFTGRAAITDPAEFEGYGGMHTRGASTSSYPKQQYKFETWDENRPDPEPSARYRDKDVSLLGLPAESDWILQGPWSDKTLMRNYQMYTWSNLIGRYAARTIFVEVFTDYDGDGVIEWDGGGEFSDTDYRGVYVLMEKIKRSDNRINVARLDSTIDMLPEVSGGYVFKKDWESHPPDPYVNFTTDIYQDSLVYVYPAPEDITVGHESYLSRHFYYFEQALSGPNFDDPVNGYAKYIDVGSFVDHHILVELAKNVDGFVVSTYLFKDRNGKINMGPIWDYNGALGGADYACDWDPEGWLHEANDYVCCDGICCIYDGVWPLDNDNAYEWYIRLFDDPEFLLKYADHWYELRENLFSTSGMLGDIGYNVDILTDYGAGDNPVDRNFTRWPNLEDEVWPNYYDNCWASGATYMDYVNWLTGWLTDRLAWMDGAIDFEYGDYPPEILLNSSPANEGGHANVGDSVTMTSSGGTIYYTTDGNDPREHGGAIYAGASAYSSAISLTGSEQFKARIRYSASNWSALNEASFAVGPVADNLRITEIMYHPNDTGDPNDPNAEFIELKNISSGTTISLNLVKFTNGIDFNFPDIDLIPGQYVVVVKDSAVFASQYPGFSGIIAGQYTGRINNAGERIEVEDAVGQIIHNFNFKDGWYPITDGSGFSLNIIDPCDPCTDHWEYQEYWQPSSVDKGTPGATDSGHVAAPGDIVINEVLSHSDGNPYEYDWIELHNTTDHSINIGGWFLSDNDPNFKKYEIAPGDPRASVPAGGYVVFTQNGDFGNQSDPGCHDKFGLSELGETVYLCSGSGGQLAGGFCAHEDFADSQADVTFGRYTKSPATANDVDFVAMSSPTYEAANAYPKVGPIVITEIMYHPPTSQQLNNYAEYVELYNTTASTVLLYDLVYPNNTWKFTDETGGIEYYFPPGTTIGGYQYILLVKNLGAYNSAGYPSLPGGVQVFEWLEGRLSNAGEKIQLSKPGEPEPDGTVPYIRVDRVNYSDGRHPEDFHELGYDPWPITPDGNGASLQRIDASEYGNDVNNWLAAESSPGTPPAAPWTELTYDDFESGFGNYTDGGDDCSLYTGGTHAHQGSNAVNIQDNSGDASSFYHTSGIDVNTPGYTQIQVEFWFKAVGMEDNEDFFVKYYDGTSWHTVAEYDSGDEFVNNQFYFEEVLINASSYNFPTDMKIKFQCDAGGNADDIYIDEVRVSGR